MTVSNKIMLKIQKHGRGYIFTPTDFLSFGSRQAIDTALSRLAAQDKIRRLTRGLYDYPKQHQLLGDLMPSLDKIAEAIARDTDSDMQISGARALYLLGLTTQVPAQTTYLTSGRSRDIKIGSVLLKLRHASSKVMAGAGSKAGTILQAIRYLGKNNLNDTMLDKLGSKLDCSDKRALKSLARYAPGWAKPSIDYILASEI